jgi:hypothetical protein
VLHTCCEISGYDFRNRRPIWVRDLTIGEGKMTYLEPTKAFKYLGIRVSITGDMRGERCQNSGFKARNYVDLYCESDWDYVNDDSRRRDTACVRAV